MILFFRTDKGSLCSIIIRLIFFETEEGLMSFSWKKKMDFPFGISPKIIIFGSTVIGAILGFISTYLVSFIRYLIFGTIRWEYSLIIGFLLSLTLFESIADGKIRRLLDNRTRFVASIETAMSLASKMAGPGEEDSRVGDSRRRGQRGKPGKGTSRDSKPAGTI